MYPLLRINLEKYEHNVRYMQTLCKNSGLTMMAVTKVFCALQPLVDVLNNLEVDFIADSRIMNLKKMDTDRPKVLLRIPSIHEADAVVKYADISLNSELETLKALDRAAEKAQKMHRIILMIDIGDLREGVFYKENIVNIVKSVEALKHVKLYGIGTNLTCYGAIIPNEKTLNKLIDVIHLVNQTLDVTFELVSGGNSSHVYLLLKNYPVAEINNLRLGEVLVLGRETAYGEAVEHMFQDVITLEADLIEIKHKPSIPEGEIGMNAFGEVPIFDDFGLMKRGILAIGKQDVDFHELIPIDEGVRLIGSSSDHIIVDLTNTEQDYQVGDVIKFKLSYGSVLSLMTSNYVEKIYDKGK